jgi:hypothetical protein
VKSEWAETVRTAIQILVSVGALAPVLVPALGLSTTAGVGAAVITVGAAVTRVSAIPAIADLLNRYFKVPKL